MKLEQQIAKLAELGFKLNEGITVGDLTREFDREEYETRPFDLILFFLGTEMEREDGWQPVCSRVWNFDTECIENSGDYTRIVKRLCEVADQPDYLKDVSDFVDGETGEAWLKYTVNGLPRNWDVEINDDWVDTLTIAYVMDDVEQGDFHFYSKDNGQAMVLFYLDPASAAELNKLSNNALEQTIK